MKWQCKRSKMRQMDLFMDEDQLFERVCSRYYLEKGFKAVKRNKEASAGA